MAAQSKMYSELLDKYQKNYVTKEQLKRRVALYGAKPDKGITAAEYQEITGEKY